MLSLTIVSTLDFVLWLLLKCAIDRISTQVYSSAKQLKTASQRETLVIMYLTLFIWLSGNRFRRLLIWDVYKTNKYKSNYISISFCDPLFANKAMFEVEVHCSGTAFRDHSIRLRFIFHWIIIKHSIINKTSTSRLIIERNVCVCLFDTKQLTIINPVLKTGQSGIQNKHVNFC